jgi:hypothetical protein
MEVTLHATCTMPSLLGIYFSAQPLCFAMELLTGEIDRPSTGRVEPVRGCLITQAVWNGPP